MNLSKVKILQLGYTQLIKVSKIIVLKYFEKITIGGLILIDNDDYYKFPNDASFSSKFNTKINVKNEKFWLRLLLNNDLGLAESYMYNEIDVDNLTTLIKIYIANRHNFNENSIIPFYLQNTATYILNSRLSNKFVQYDISNAIFKIFLSDDMSYTCGIYKDAHADISKAFTFKSNDNSVHKHKFINNTKRSFLTNENAVNEGDNLHNAQLRKLRTIIKKANLGNNSRVLEIGTGFGSISIEICLQFPNVTIDTLTLSQDEKKFTEERIQELGYEKRISVHLMDYRKMPLKWKNKFDSVISIETIEKLGIDSLSTYWKCIDWALNTRGIGVFQIKTIPESRYKSYIKSTDFIERYIDPNFNLPTLTILFETLFEGTEGNLMIDNVKQIGVYYARTFRDWRKNFIENFDLIVDKLKADYNDIDDISIEIFKRKWIYYFTYCEAGFDTRVIGDHILTIVSICIL